MKNMFLVVLLVASALPLSARAQTPSEWNVPANRSMLSFIKDGFRLVQVIQDNRDALAPMVFYYLQGERQLVRCFETIIGGRVGGAACVYLGEPPKN